MGIELDEQHVDILSFAGNEVLVASDRIDIKYMMKVLTETYKNRNYQLTLIKVSIL